jgi:hypothetical protein
VPREVMHPSLLPQLRHDSINPETGRVEEPVSCGRQQHLEHAGMAECMHPRGHLGRGCCMS